MSYKKTKSEIMVLMLIFALIFSIFPVSAQAVKTLTMDKNIYTVGETIRVKTENWSVTGKDFLRIYKGRPTNYNSGYVAQTYNLWGKSNYVFNTYDWEPGEYNLIAFNDANFNNHIANIVFNVKVAPADTSVGRNVVIDRESYAKGEKITISTFNWKYYCKDFIRIYRYPMTSYGRDFVYDSSNDWGKQIYTVDTANFQTGKYQLIAFDGRDIEHNTHIADIVFTVTDENNFSAKTAMLDKDSYQIGDRINVSTTNWGGNASSNGDFFRIYKMPVTNYTEGYVANSWGDWGKSSYSFDTSSWKAGEYRLLAFDKGNWNVHVTDKQFILSDSTAFRNNGTEITFQKSALVDLSKINHTQRDKQLFIGWQNSDGTAVSGKQTFNAGTKLIAKYIPLDSDDNSCFAVAGSEVRSGEKPALRFIINKGVTLSENIPNISEYGAVILPTEILAANSFKKLALNQVYVYNGKKYSAVGVKAENIYREESQYKQYTVCVTNINGLKLTRSYTVRGYIKYTDINGFERVIYTDEYVSDIYNAAKSYEGKSGLYTQQKRCISSVVSSSLPIVSSQENFDRLKKDILENKNATFNATGKIYYVSESGNDSNSGISISYPLKTLAGVAAKSLNSGDAVLFNRGDVFRGNLTLTNNVYYGAYGQGNKPQINGSLKNYATSEWKRVGKNIWTVDNTFDGDIGNIVFGQDETVGYLRSSKIALRQNFDYYCDIANSNRIYLYLEDNPAKLFDKIEICSDKKLFGLDGKSKITIENIAFKYTGGHAIRGSNTNNIIVRSCEIGFAGGSYLDSYGDGNTRYGNAIEFIGTGIYNLVDNNYIYNIYDTGITHQSSGEVRNFTVKNNLVEACGMGCIEYWHPQDTVIKDVLYSDNFLRYAGYGFGGVQRPDKEMSACIMSNCKPNSLIYNEADNFKIQNNIFEISRYQLLNLGSAVGTPPKLHGNTYVQVSDGILGYYNEAANVLFDSNAEMIIKNNWSDATATVKCY